MRGLKLIGQERLAENDETFLWKLSANRMNPVEILYHPVEPSNLPIHKANARIYLVGGSLWRGRGIHGLPGQGDSVGGVKSEETVEEGRSRPRQSSDEDRPAYFFLNNLSILPSVFLHPYVVDEEPDQVMSGGQMSHEIKPCLGLQGFEQYAKRNAEGLISEVIDSRLP